MHERELARDRRRAWHASTRTHGPVETLQHFLHGNPTAGAGHRAGGGRVAIFGLIAGERFFTPST
jgi:hypothetical protein